MKRWNLFLDYFCKSPHKGHKINIVQVGALANGAHHLYHEWVWLYSPAAEFISRTFLMIHGDLPWPPQQCICAKRLQDHAASREKWASGIGKRILHESISYYRARKHIRQDIHMHMHALVLKHRCPSPATMLVASLKPILSTPAGAKASRASQR